MKIKNSVLDKTKFTQTQFHKGSKRARMMTNQARFKASKEVGTDLYEMQFGHKKIAIDLPIQVN